MGDDVSEILVPDLNEATLAELASIFDGDSLRLRDPLPTSKEGRDISTATAAIVVSLSALRVLALWISRHTKSEETEISVQTKRRDGTTKTLTFRSKSSSAQSEADVLKQLAAACRVDLNEALEAPGEQKELT